MYDTTFCYKTRKCFSCDVTGLTRATNKAVWCTAAAYKRTECTRVEALLLQVGH